MLRDRKGQWVINTQTLRKEHKNKAAPDTHGKDEFRYTFSLKQGHAPDRNGCSGEAGSKGTCWFPLAAKRCVAC